jgi:hypothetical protein
MLQPDASVTIDKDTNELMRLVELNLQQFDF